jgi:hypothetical protein
MEGKKDRIIDLCGIYREMDEEGKKQMISVVEEYLTVQSILKERNSVSVNKLKKFENKGSGL